MSSNIVINPFSKASSINSFYINEILNLGPFLDDRSSVGKMRDAYPVSLFNFQNAIIFLENNKFEAFSYIFIYALWNKAILNVNLHPFTRKYLLLTLLHILVNLFMEHSKRLPENIKFKKSKDNHFVTIFTKGKLKSWIPTVAIQASEIEKGDLKLGIGRAGSHCVEIRIGSIRVYCKYDHRLEKIFHSAASITIIKEIAHVLFPDAHKKSCLSSGRCRLSMGDLVLLPDESYETFAEKNSD